MHPLTDREITELVDWQLSQRTDPEPMHRCQACRSTWQGFTVTCPECGARQ